MLQLEIHHVRVLTLQKLAKTAIQALIYCSVDYLRPGASKPPRICFGLVLKLRVIFFFLNFVKYRRKEEKEGGRKSKSMKASKKARNKTFDGGRLYVAAKP